MLPISCRLGSNYLVMTMIKFQDGVMNGDEPLKVSSDSCLDILKVYFLAWNTNYSTIFLGFHLSSASVIWMPKAIFIITAGFRFGEVAMNALPLYQLLQIS